MLMLGCYYVQYYNYCFQHCVLHYGQTRYKAILIDSETYLMMCMLYIELNPIRMLIIIDPSNYPWSSYRLNALE